MVIRSIATYLVVNYLLVLLLYGRVLFDWY